MTAKPTPALSRGKRTLFTIVMCLLPLGFFGALEGGLRAFGYGESIPLFVPVRAAPEYQVLNPAIARRYFFRLRQVPTGMHDAFLVEKDSTALRIFVQGGSSAAGYPYYFGGSFSRMLEQRLAQTLPERRVELVNTSLAAVNSYTLLDHVSEILDQEPDAVLIYAGHNEFYGALGAGSAESVGRQPWVVNLYLRLRGLRIMQLLRGVLSAIAVGGAAPSQDAAEGTLMERMVREQSIPYQSAVYLQGLRQFRSNLRSLLRVYQRAGVPVFIGTLASNERSHEPFESTGTPGSDLARWRSRYEEAVALAQSGDVPAAARAMEQVVAQDSAAALGHYALGVLLGAEGRYGEAREAFLQAKDRDNLRFRASEEFNAVIREEAQRAGATVVETQGALVAAAQDGIIGSDLMLEHLHPNLDGYFLMADAYYDALLADNDLGLQGGYIPRGVARREVLFTAVDSLFGAYRVQQLMNSWPFVPQGTPVPPMDTLTATNAVEAIALEYFHRRLVWYAATDSLRHHYESQGDWHRALQATLAMVQQYPYLPRPYALAGDILVQQRRLREALTYYEAATEIEPLAEVFHMTGMVHLALRQFAEAQSHLESAASMEPRNSSTLLQLAQAYLVTGEVAKARLTLGRLLAVAPGHRQGMELLGLIEQATSTEP